MKPRALKPDPCHVSPAQERIDEVYDTLLKRKLPFGAHAGEPQPLERYAFRDDPKESKVFWDVRKGLIPIVGGGREPGAAPGLTAPDTLHPICARALFPSAAACRVRCQALQRLAPLMLKGMEPPTLDWHQVLLKQCSAK